MRMIEPLGLVTGPAASILIRDGAALPLAGGPSAFTVARLIPEGGTTGIMVPVEKIPDFWAPELSRLTSAPPVWAGITAKPAVMGILNVTPDSFSDGGVHARHEDAIASGLRMIAAGADLLDLGGESTRPGAIDVDPVEERRRVLPVIEALSPRIPVSIDTRNAATMRAALAAGARIVNDVSAFAHDPEAASVVAEAGCPVVLMHMRGTPLTMSSLARYEDVTVELVRELAGRIAVAEAAGIDRARIALDPGIGFAKTPDQSVEVQRRLALLLNLGCPILLGVSRKKFIQNVTKVDPPKERLPASIAAALAGLGRGAAILRVHDVAETVQAMRMWRALRD